MENFPAKSFDIIIVGGGRAADLANVAANAGKTVALIERDRLGGTCPNRGCVPSKLLIGHSEVARRVREAGRHHIDATLHGIDSQKIFDEVNAWIASVDGRYESRMPEKATLYRGHGKFLSNKVVAVENLQGEEIARLTAETIVIATGTRPRPAPETYAAMPVWTSDSIFPLKENPPKSLTVIGGGFIGCELAAFFSAIGTETNLYVRKDTLLPKTDGEIADIFKKEFSTHTPVHYHSNLTVLEYDGSQFTATFSQADGSQHIRQSERILFATGRIPNSDTLGLENTDIQLDRRGFILTDDYQCSTVDAIYTAGDIAGKHILRHMASHDVYYLRQKLLEGAEEPIDYNQVPYAVFTEPELASVGQTEEQLQNEGTPYVSAVRNWRASARAMASKLKYPRVKLLVCPQSYAILGCHLIGPDSSTLIHQMLMLIHLKNDVREIPKMIHIHPALPEIFVDAANTAIQQIQEHEA